MGKDTIPPGEDKSVCSGKLSHVIQFPVCVCDHPDSVQAPLTFSPSFLWSDFHKKVTWAETSNSLFQQMTNLDAWGTGNTGSSENPSVAPDVKFLQAPSLLTQTLQSCASLAAQMSKQVQCHTTVHGSFVLQITLLTSACRSGCRCLAAVTPFFFSLLCEDKQCYWHWKLLLPKRFWTLGRQAGE